MSEIIKIDKDAFCELLETIQRVGKEIERNYKYTPRPVIRGFSELSKPCLKLVESMKENN